MYNQVSIENFFPVISTVSKKILDLYKIEGNISKKVDNSPLTEADIASNFLICNFLKKYNWPILSEENIDNLERLNTKKIWILDPLDGTADFLQKTGDFSIMLGLVENGRPIFGLVYWPTKNRIFWAKKNEGAFVIEKNGESKKIHVSKKNNLEAFKAVVSRNHLEQNVLEVLKKLKIKVFEKVGSNGIKGSFIASGKADVFLNLTDKMGEWDSCAIDIIIHEAGGRLTDMNGDLIIYNKKTPKLKNGLVVSNGILHDNIISAIENK